MGVDSREEEEVGRRQWLCEVGEELRLWGIMKAEDQTVVVVLKIGVVPHHGGGR